MKREIAATENEVKRQRAAAADLLYRQYTAGRPDTLAVLLSGRDPNAIARDLHYLTYIGRARSELIAALGATPEGGRLVNDDVMALAAAGTVTAAADLVNPYCFAPAIAPHIAAAEAGIAIDVERIRRAYLALAAAADRVIVEGAGGFRVPLGPGLDTADLAAALGLPVVVVVGMRLGCLNHALLTVEAVHASGLALAGWVANHIDPAMPRAAENVSAPVVDWRSQEQ